MNSSKDKVEELPWGMTICPMRLIESRRKWKYSLLNTSQPQGLEGHPSGLHQDPEEEDKMILPLVLHRGLGDQKVQPRDNPHLNNHQ